MPRTIIRSKVIRRPSNGYGCLVVDESLVTVFSVAVSGPEESVLTSTLRVLLLDSDVVVGAGVAEAGAAAGAADAAGGACWQPLSIRPSAISARDAGNLQ
jgi:hypothetical protein